MTTKQKSQSTNGLKLRGSDRNILFVGAHPDDIELGALGTIIKYNKQDKVVKCIIATNGERGVGDKRKFNRVEETLTALVGAGVERKDVRFLELPDTRLFTVPDKLIMHIENACKEWHIERIFFHSVNDRHMDHKTVHDASISGARFVPNQLTYQSNSSTTENYVGKYYSDITPYMDLKEKLIKNHKSQYEQGRQYLDPSSIRALARVHGTNSKQHGVIYAEAFEIERFVEVLA
ncbi:MAG: PIG-L family deacetylase [Candidatus Micrarchaeota archaeon]|nr:PIG-L family deacetylase [Candidatus Micrarchaeota archaeon]